MSKPCRRSATPASWPACAWRTDVPVDHSPAPTSLDEVLSPQWLAETLKTPVAGASVVEQLVTVATKVRFAVQFDGSPPPGTPGALCVKGYFGPESAHLVTAGQIEVRFYTEVAPNIDVEVPPCVHAATDPETGH